MYQNNVVVNILTKSLIIIYLLTKAKSYQKVKIC